MITNLEPARAPWRLFAALSSALLIGAIAISTTSGAPAAPAPQKAGAARGVPVAADARHAPAASAAPAEAVAGSWTLGYDWGCDGSYTTASFTANADGTWRTDRGYTGLWVTVAGMLTFTFDDSETTYSGTLAGRSVTGMQTTFTGVDGCFYMLKTTAATPATAANPAAGQLDEAGRA